MAGKDKVVAEVEAKIKPIVDEKTLKQSLAQALSNLPPHNIKLGVKLDTKSYIDAVNNLPPKNITLGVKLDHKSFNEAINNLPKKIITLGLKVDKTSYNEAIASLAKKTVTLGLKVDKNSFTEAINNLPKKSVLLGLKIDKAGLREQLSNIKNNISVGVKVSVSSFREAIKNLPEVRAKIGVRLDTAQFRSEVNRLSQIRISTRNMPTLAVQADQSQLFQVERRLAIITNQIRRINRMTLKVNSRYNNRSGGGGSRGSGSGGQPYGDRWYNNSFYTQFVHFVGRSSKGLGSFGEALSDVLAKAQASGGALGRLAGAASVVTAGFAGLAIIVQAIASTFNILVGIGKAIGVALKPGYELMAQRDTTMLTTKAALKTSASVDGRAVTNEEAASESTFLFNRAMQEAAKTVLNLNDILTAQQGVLPMLLNKGMTPKQAQDVIFGVAGVAKTGRLAPNQVLQETRDLAQGSITARTSQVANILGITNQDLAKFKGDVDALYEYLMQKFQEYTKVMEEYANTPVGAVEQLQETWGIAAMTIVDQYGPLIVEVAQSITKSLGSFDEQGNFHLSDWLKELADGLQDIVVFAASAADSLFVMIQQIVGGNDPVEVFINFIIWLIDCCASLTGVILGVIQILKGLWVIFKSGVSFVEAATKAVIGFGQACFAAFAAMSGNPAKALGWIDEAKKSFSEAGQAVMNGIDIEGQWKGTIQTGWTASGNKDGYRLFDGMSGPITELVKRKFEDAKNRDIPKGRDVQGMRGNAQNKEDEKARKKAIQLDQKRLKDYLSNLKEILQDSLDRLKDLLEKNEVSYKEGFTGLKEYLERKTELERQQAELELKYAQDEMKAIQETMFNTPYEKSKAEHDTQRKIDKYTKALGKAVETQEAVKRDLGNFTTAFNNASNRLAIVLGGMNNSSSSNQPQVSVQSPTSNAGWQDFGDALVNIAMYVSRKTGIDAKLLWAQMMHETGGEYKDQSKYYDHNYSGISVFDSAYNSRGLERMSRGSEGGWYERYASDQEFADAFIEVLMQSRYQKTGGLANMHDTSSYAHALKVGGYYTDSEYNYQRNMESWLKQAPDFSKFSSAIQSSVDNLGQQVGVQLTTSITGALELALGKDGGNLLYKQMPHLTEGCVEAVVALGSYFNEHLLAEAKKGTNNVDVLRENLEAAGVTYEKYTQGTVLQPGDVLVNNNGNHVMLVMDKDRVVGNSSNLANPVYGGTSGIVTRSLHGWDTNTAVGVLRTGSIGVNLGGSNVLLQAAHGNKEAMENFNLMQELVDKYNDVVSAINDDIFGNMPMLDVKLRSLYQQLTKVSRSNEPQDRRMADALRTRIKQETSKIITDALTKQLEFNLNRISTTGSYTAIDIAYGKNFYRDTSYAELASKYYDFFFKPTNFKELKDNIANTKSIIGILDSPEKFYDNYMDINNKLWSMVNDNHKIWDEYNGRLTNIQIDEKSLESLRTSNGNKDEINFLTEKIAKERQELTKFTSDAVNAPVINTIKQLEDQKNKLSELLSSNNLSKDSIKTSSELYKSWKKANDELWEMMNVEDKKGTTEQINLKLEEVKSLLDAYNKSRTSTDSAKDKLRVQLASLETELNLAKQRPANQIEELNKQFIEATNAGNSNLAEEIRGKLIDSYNKLKAVYDSWISAINSRFDAMKEYFDILPMTNLQREQGEEELTAYRNWQLAEGYRENLSKYRKRYSEVYNKRVADELELKSLKDQGLPETTDRVKELGAEISRLNEEERYWNQTIIETKQRLRISEELSKLPTLLEKTRRVAKQALEDGLVTFLTDGVNEAENLGEALRNLAIDFLKTMQQFFAKQMVTNLMNHWFPVKTGDTDQRLTTSNLAPGEWSNIITNPIVTAINEQTAQLLGRSSTGVASSGVSGISSTALVSGNTMLNMSYDEYMNKQKNPYSFNKEDLGLKDFTKGFKSSINEFKLSNDLNTQALNTTAQVNTALNATTQANTATTQAETVATQAQTTATTTATTTEATTSAQKIAVEQQDIASTNATRVELQKANANLQQANAKTTVGGTGVTVAGGANAGALGAAGAGSSAVFGFKGLGGGGFFNGGIFQNILGAITDFVGSAFGQLAGDFLAIKSIFSGDTKEKLLGTIFLEIQLLYIGQQQQILWLQQIATRLSTMSAGFGFAAEGGYISGKGTSTSDSIPTMLSSGEYVIKASSVRKYGTNFLNAVNNGNFTKIKSGVHHYAQGGLVSDLAQEQTARGISNFGKDISNNISNTANISVALVRDEQEGMKQLLRSPEGQRIMLDFSRKYASVTSRF